MGGYLIMDKIRKIKKRKTISKIRRKRILGLIRLLFILAIIATTAFLVNRNKYKEHKATFPQLTIYRNSIETKGYGIYDEKIFSSKGNGVIIYNVYEGQKVPVNYVIANVNLMQDLSKLKDELIKVQAAIDYKNNINKPNEKDYKISDTQISIIKNIQKFIKDKDFNNLILSINNLDLNTKHSVSISELSELLNLDLEELELKRRELTEKISTNNIEYRAEFSGVISMDFDGLEEFYNTEVSFDKYNTKYLSDHSKVSISNNNRIQVAAGDNLYKLIDNLAWYMAIPINNKDFIENITTGDSFIIMTENSEELEGKVVDINMGNSDAVIILKFEDRLADFYLQRILNISLIKQTEDAFLIPSSSIVERNGVSGIYVQEIHGLVKFIPIKILEEKEEIAYIERGNIKSMINIDNKEVKTLTINDSVIIDPQQVDNEQVIN